MKIFNSSRLTFSLILILILSFFFVATQPVQLKQNNDIELEYLETLLKYINKFYVDKSKINNQEILLNGINKLEIELDEVMVDFPEKNDTKFFKLQVNHHEKLFNNVVVDNTSSLIQTFRQVFNFIFENLESNEVDLRDVEYSVADKILNSLDPHSAIITPDIYKEFLIETEGSFGGLGIVIGIRDGQLTVISPIEGTPAYNAGIKSNDKIVQIEAESTINMSLIEAVGKLRGKKGSKVNIFVMRENFPKPKLFSITRDTIKIESVEAFDLTENILYIRIRDFQRNTLSSLKKEIISREDLEGIILDLRGNPGGLLDQAQKISDLFLKKGTIVTTKVGDSSKSYKARYKVPEYDGKVVVLVNSGSASASEIVAAALHNNDRAILIGERTFGKGSVQQIFDLNDGSAIKLTIANYFTPGDISIQDTGVTPDIILTPSLISEDTFIYTQRLKEEEELNGKKLNKSEFEITYLEEFSEEVEDGEEKPDEAMTKAERLEKLDKDFYISLAKNLIHNSGTTKRVKSLKKAEKLIEEMSDEEQLKISRKLKEIGIDWARGETLNPLIEIKTYPKNIEFRAGSEHTLEIEVTNRGINPVYQLRGITDSEFVLYKGRELVIGKLNPGESRKWKLKFDVPEWISNREDKVEISFVCSGKNEILKYDMKIKTVEKKSPSYAYNYEIIEDGRFGSSGNGDNILTRDENVVLKVNIQNTGPGNSAKTIATLKNKEGDNIYLQNGRFEFENFSADEIKSALFKFKILKPVEKIDLQLQILDEDFRELRLFDISIPNFRDGQIFTKDKKLGVVLENSYIYGSNYSDAPSIAYIEKDSLVTTGGMLGNWVKVSAKNDISGWMIKKNLKFMSSRISVEKEQVVRKIFDRPPYINLNPIPLATKKPKVVVSGYIQDEDTLKNISVYKVEDKIRLINQRTKKAPFNFTVDLDEGINVFNIIAKDKNDNISKKTFTIRKDS